VKDGGKLKLPVLLNLTILISKTSYIFRVWRKKARKR